MPRHTGTQSPHSDITPRAQSTTGHSRRLTPRRNPPAGVIFHSDRGAQYTSSDFARYCKRNNIRRSLGRTGICYDNAVSESTFATYKKELIHTRPWPTIADLKRETDDWIENYFNTKRRHSTLGYLTPVEFELGYRNISQLAA
jgi:putative transposase